MDKRIILSVAGSGKTTYIVSQLNEKERTLIITYTINNQEILRSRIINKFGYFPENITLMGYYTFLYSFCFKPFLSFDSKIKGIYWEKPNPRTLRFKRSNPGFYIKNKRLYSNRIAKLLETKGLLNSINKRIEKYFENLFIDEVQDFGGHDFNFLKSIAKANVRVLFVGDFYQHTFDTSTDGNVNKNIYADYDKYVDIFKKINIIPDFETLKESYRCSKSVCDFISKDIGVEIASKGEEETIIKEVTDNGLILGLFHNDEVIKLFYQNCNLYPCFSQNWGKSKGETFENVCIVLNKTTFKHFKSNKLKELAPKTKNKFYVACSRANKNVFFVSEELIKNICLQS